MEKSIPSTLNKHKRNRHHHKQRLPSDGDTAISTNSLQRAACSSADSPAKTKGSYSVDQGAALRLPISKRVKYSENELKIERTDDRLPINPGSPSRVPNRVEIDINYDTSYPRPKTYAEKKSIKVEIDDEQREGNHSSSLSPHLRATTVITPALPSSHYQHQHTHSQHQDGQLQQYVVVESHGVAPLEHHAGGGTRALVAVQDRDTSASAGSPPPNVPQRSSEVPILKKDYGPFHFTVALDEREDTNKTPSWLMNTKNKLYTNINKAVPFHVKLTQWPQSESDYQVRVTAVFSSHQYARAPVKRCPIHASPQHQTNIDFPFPEHVVRLDHPNAGYERSATGRLSVVVPLEQPQAGPLGETMPLLLRFMCLCSCSGGINRRPLAIIFTLEKVVDSAGNVVAPELYGRQTVDVRVCACPMRDYRNEEGTVPRQDRRCGRKRGGRGSSGNGSLHHHHLSSPASTRSGGQYMHPSISRLELLPPPGPDDSGGGGLDDMYTISVRGRKLFEFLSEMKESYLRIHADCFDDEYVSGNIQSEDDPQLSEATKIADNMAIEEQQEQLYGGGAQQLTRYTTAGSTRYMNGGGRVVGSNAFDAGGNGSNNLVVTLTNNGNNSQDIEMMDEDYVSESNGSQSTINQSQNMSRNSSFTSSVCNSQTIVHTSAGAFHLQPQQPQQHIQQIQSPHHQLQQQQQQQHHQPQQQRDLTIHSNNQHSGIGNLTNVANIVAHHQIIGSMKNHHPSAQMGAARTMTAASGGTVQNGTTTNQPVLLIYNASGLDDQLVQTLNARKIILPKPVLDGSGQAGLKTSTGNTIVSFAPVGGANVSSVLSGEQQDDAMEESVSSGGEDVKPVPDSTNISHSNISERNNEDKQMGSHNLQQQQFRHIPISAVAQNPSRDQRNKLCIAKKMPRLKPIPAKIVSGPTSVGVSMGAPITQHLQQIGQMILTSPGTGSNQIILTRASSSGHQIIVPLSQAQPLDPKDVSSCFPNMSVVKQEPLENSAYVDVDQKDDNMQNVIQNVIRHKPNAVTTNVISESGAVFTLSRHHPNTIVTSRGGGSLQSTNPYITNHQQHNSDINSGGHHQTYTTTSCNTSNYNNTYSYSNSGNTEVLTINGQPDSAEMLAAQVLASSLGSRHVPVSCTGGREGGL